MASNLPQLPDISTAKLPAMYQAATKALAECSRIDECQKWADKAEALASYAKQARDDQMRKMADRIQARAIRRCGELLKLVEPSKGGQPTRNGGGTSRTKAAQEAGLSKRQKDTALRVANVPEHEFNGAIESEDPPTVTQLADRGKKKLLDLGESNPADFVVATQAIGQLRDLAKFASANDPVIVAAGVRPQEYAQVRSYVRAIDVWLDQFITRVGD
jgi:hypothetical protein